MSIRRRLALAISLVLAALVAAPAGPAGAADWSGRYSIWRDGAFATQYLDASCVGATIQMTLNLVKGERDHSKSRQLDYLAYAGTSSLYPVEDEGADPQGWANALNHFGGGTRLGLVRFEHPSRRHSTSPQNRSGSRTNRSACSFTSAATPG